MRFLRQMSITCFGLALGLALVLKSLAVPENLAELAFLSVLITATLSHFLPSGHAGNWGAPVGIVSIAGLSAVYMGLPERFPSIVTLILVCAVLSFAGVVLVILANSFDSKGAIYKYES